jgi:sialate O-acetylesterase
MVLQRDRPVPVWGTARPGTVVKVFIGRQKKVSTAGNGGKWLVVLEPQPAGGPFTMAITGPETFEFSDVWFGDVWLCSGQSNMAERLPVQGDFADEQVAILTKQDPALGEWCKRVYAERNKLLANSATPEIRLFKVAKPSKEGRGSDLEEEVTREPWAPFKDGWQVAGPLAARHFSAVGFSFGHYLQPHVGVKLGLLMSARGGSAVASWTPLVVQQKNPKLRYKLDAWDAQARTYEDCTTYQEKKALMQRNTRAFNALSPAERATRKLPPPPIPSHNKPGLLYNAMIHPLLRYPIKGVVWYQGEADSGGPTSLDYRYALAFMVRTWRGRWGAGDFPFYCVQLSALTAKQPREETGAGGNDTWVLVQHAQLTIDEELKNSGGVVSVDLGRGDIHPRDKLPIGERLSLMARARTYGEKDLVYQGPVLAGLAARDGKVTLTFNHMGSGITTKDGKKPDGFAISADSKKWFWADARIAGPDTVEVSHPDVDAPSALRYSWHRHPWGNVINKEGLPMRGFDVKIRN